MSTLFRAQSDGNVGMTIQKGRKAELSVCAVALGEVRFPHTSFLWGYENCSYSV